MNPTWIRPWYPGGGAGDHIDQDCPVLTRWTSNPVEGSGWLDPDVGRVCDTCLPSWDAVCDTCDAAMSDDEYDEYESTEAGAKLWQLSHQCYPQVRLIPPPRQEPTPTPPSPSDRLRTS